MEENREKFALLFVFGVVVCFISILPISNAKLVITVEEMKALEKFRPLVNDHDTMMLTQEYMKTDSYLLRWLQVSKLNVNDAVERLRKSLKWRRENKIDSILNETFPDFPDINLPGVDYEGRLVSPLSLGQIDIRKLVLGGKRDKFLRYSLYDLERGIVKAFEAVRRNNETLADYRVVSIVDLQGFSPRKHACLACIPFLTTYLRQAEDNYPGYTAHNVYINAPRIALAVIQTLSGFTSEETRRTVKIFGTDRAEWTKYLHTIIPPNQLTYQFGGTRKI